MGWLDLKGDLVTLTDTSRPYFLGNETINNIDLAAVSMKYKLINK